jgi:hypothetical protein
MCASNLIEFSFTSKNERLTDTLLTSRISPASASTAGTSINDARTLEAKTMAMLLWHTLTSIQQAVDFRFCSSHEQTVAITSTVVSLSVFPISRQSFMAYLKCVVRLCIFSFSTFLVSLYLLTEDSRLFESLPDAVMDIFAFDTEIDVFDDSIDNDENVSTVAFQSRIGDFYPRFPMLIETQHLTNKANRSKLILLGNGFFDVPTWGIVSTGDTSTDTSKEERRLPSYLYRSKSFLNFQ